MFAGGNIKKEVIKNLTNRYKEFLFFHFRTLFFIKGCENKKAANVGNSGDFEFRNPFGFEQPLKKIKLEDQSDKIQRLNETINKLRGNVETRIQKLDKGESVCCFQMPS